MTQTEGNQLRDWGLCAGRVSGLDMAIEMLRGEAAQAFFDEDDAVASRLRRMVKQLKKKQDPVKEELEKHIQRDHARRTAVDTVTDL